MDALNYCPFCGGSHELSVELFPYAEFGDSAFGAYVRCGHCAARGGVFIQPSKYEAVESATRNWNDAYRPSSLSQWVRQTWGTFCHDLNQWRFRWK